MLDIPVTGSRYDSLRRAWSSAVKERPGDYLLVRLKLLARMAAITGPPDPVFQDPPGGPGLLPRFPALAQRATDYLFAFTDNHNVLAGGPLHRTWVYLLVILAGAVWLLRRRRRPGDLVLGLLCVALLVFVVVVALAAPSGYYRFLYPDVAGGTVVAVLGLAAAVSATIRAHDPQREERGID